MERNVEKGIAPKSQVAIVFSGPIVYDDAHLLALRAMTMVLQGRLFDTIRQELGGTYSITAEQRTQKVPRPEYTHPHRMGVRPGAHGRPGAARVRRDPVRAGHVASRRTR